MSPAIATLLARAAQGETALPLGHLWADGPSIHAALRALGASEGEADDLLARGTW